MDLFRKLTAVSAALMLSLSAVNVPEELTSASADSVQQEVWFNDLDPSFNGGEPIRGADISSVLSLEKAGVKFYNDLGQEQDLFKTLAEHGVNYIRVRVWNEPFDSDDNTYGGGYCDLENAKEIGRRAAQYGMKLLVDIHYSDFWADPERQTRPKYWAEHDHDTLKGEIYKWTSWVVQSIDEAGADIGMVQVGNETSCFFCGETDMYQICDLFSSGEKAIREYDKDILIVHHFPDPSSGHYDWYAQVMEECGLDYDIFATSYYPYWHGTASNLTSVLKSIGDKYDKYVMVAETAYPYTSANGDAYNNGVSAYNTDLPFYYDISVEGQAQCFTDVFQAVANTGSHGIGVFYWEPAWLGLPDLSYNEQKELWNTLGIGWASDYAVEYDEAVTAAGGSGFDNQALFDFYGHPLDSLNVFENIYPRNENIIPKEGAYLDDGEYRIRNLNSGMYLTVANGEGKSGSNVIQYTADGAADYNIWRLESAGDGYYRIYSMIDGGKTYLLDLDYGRTEDRTNIGIYTDTGADAQLFKLVESADGSYIIVTKSSKDRSGVEIADADSKDGANAQQFTLNGHNCQSWIFEPVEERYLSGDLDGDGTVSGFDLALLRREVINGSSLNTADVNEDGKCGIADVVSLSNYLLKHENEGIRWHGTPENTIFPGI